MDRQLEEYLEDAAKDNQELYELVAVLWAAYKDAYNCDLATARYIQELASLVADRMGGYQELTKLARAYHKLHDTE